MSNGQATALSAAKAPNGTNNNVKGWGNPAAEDKRYIQDG